MWNSICIYRQFAYSAQPTWIYVAVGSFSLNIRVGFYTFQIHIWIFWHAQHELGHYYAPQIIKPDILLPKPRMANKYLLLAALVASDSE